jgi:hypothetical protein
MKRKTIISVFKIIILILAIISVPYYLYEYATYKYACHRIEDVAWWNAAAPDERRCVCHIILQYSQAGHHDAYVALIQYGNNDSIPILIHALKCEGDTKKGELMDCQKGHCLEALVKITGKDLGVNYSDWEVLLNH